MVSEHLAPKHGWWIESLREGVTVLVLGFWTHLSSGRYEQPEILGVSQDSRYEIVFVVGSSWTNTPVLAG